MSVTRLPADVEQAREESERIWQKNREHLGLRRDHGRAEVRRTIPSSTHTPTPIEASWQEWRDTVTYPAYPWNGGHPVPYLRLRHLSHKSFVRFELGKRVQRELWRADGIRPAASGRRP